MLNIIKIQSLPYLLMTVLMTDKYYKNTKFTIFIDDIILCNYSIFAYF